MSYPEERLIRVRSEGELRVGVTVVTTGCNVCGKHWTMLLRKLPSALDGATRWDGVTSCSDKRFPVRFFASVREGRLFRLDTSEKTNERTRELERAK